MTLKMFHSVINKMEEIFVKSFIFRNDAVKELRLFESQKTQSFNDRIIILKNLSNMQEQMFLLQSTYFQTLNLEKKIWQLDRSKCFWEVDCQENSEKFFKENFRMSRQTFKLLCSLLPSFGKGDTNYRKAIPLEKRVAVAVYALGSSAEYRSLANLFGVGKSTVGHILKEFCILVWSKLKMKYFSCFPLTCEKIEECVNGFHAMGFPQCLGAIDGCHLEIHPNSSDAVDYFNYKGWYSTVLFALVDYRYRFMYINVGSPGRCNDSSIFEDSLLKKTLDQCPLLPQMAKTINGVEVPIALIGDSAFRFSKNLMKPYPFHCEQDQMQKNFNYALSKSRRVVAFGLLKARFRRIGKGMDNSINNANAIIKACCVLHNFLNENNDVINNKWLIEQRNYEYNEQPTHITILGDENASAEEIRRAIAGPLTVRSETDENM